MNSYTQRYIRSYIPTVLSVDRSCDMCFMLSSSHVCFIGRQSVEYRNPPVEKGCFPFRRIFRINFQNSKFPSYTSKRKIILFHGPLKALEMFPVMFDLLVLAGSIQVVSCMFPHFVGDWWFGLVLWKPRAIPQQHIAAMAIAPSFMLAPQSWCFNQHRKAAKRFPHPPLFQLAGSYNHHIHICFKVLKSCQVPMFKLTLRVKSVKSHMLGAENQQPDHVLHVLNVLRRSLAHSNTGSRGFAVPRRSVQADRSSGHQVVGWGSSPIPFGVRNRDC